MNREMKIFSVILCFCLGMIAIAVLIWWLGLRVTVEHSSGPVPYTPGETELMRLIAERRVDHTRPLSEIRKSISREPSQLLQPNPPMGMLPLEYAARYGMCDVVRELLLSKPEVYDPEALLNAAEIMHERGHSECLGIFEEVEPKDDKDRYEREIQERMADWQ